MFNEGSDFSCPDACERYGCKDPNLHVSISLLDLISISLSSGQKVSDLFEKSCKLGFDPLGEEDPWVGRISLEMQKPCPFLKEKLCSVYSGRPLACVLFPEYDAMVGRREVLAGKKFFQQYPCIQNPCTISPQRKEILTRLMEMSVNEHFLSDFYLFGVSPFLLDVKTISGEVLEGVSFSGEGKAPLPYGRLEDLLLQKMRAGGYLDEWRAKVKELDRSEGLDLLWQTKRVIDGMVGIGGEIEPQVAYQFDGNRLLPIRFCNASLKRGEDWIVRVRGQAEAARRFSPTSLSDSV